MANFQRRHYEQVADIFRVQKPGDHWDANKHVQHNLLLRDFRDLFARDNPNFNAEKFLEAAGGFAPKGF